MEQPVRNQADASNARFIRARRKEIIDATLEQGVVDVINWGNLPVTQRVTEAFASFEKKVLTRLKRGAIGEKRWSEAEGRALSLSLEYLGILEDLLDRAQKQFSGIQEKKKREAK